MNLEPINIMQGDRWSYPDNDCWAVFRKASAEIFGRKIAPVAVPAEPDEQRNKELFASTFPGDQWLEVMAPSPGCACMFLNQDGDTVHIGLYIMDGMVLHCLGSPKAEGRTRYDELALVCRIYAGVEFYECIP